ncbi:MAG: lptF [Proteobacteria bacterium]|nr:lptF [Pseudomonadota bacterium]MBS1246804.1 lptF [Pseudomonadota bacterium]
MQIINRALLRELTTTTLAVAFIFVALFMVVSLVKILAKAAAGSFPAKFIFTMLGLQTVEILGLMLPLAFYIGLLITLGRWYQDNEMTVLAACGVGLTQLLRPVLLIAAGFAVVVTLLAFYLAPIATRLVAQIKQDDSSRYEAAAITPGVFNEIQSGDKVREGGVYYVENIGPGGEMQKVFVATRRLGRQGVVVAKTGREMTDAASGDRFLVLDNGVRYDGAPGQGDYRMIVFERYTIRVELPAPVLRHTSYHAMSTWQLIAERNRADSAEQHRAASAELHWRISKPVALLLLTVFALVFAYTEPRRGRYASLFVAIAAYFVYSNLLGVADAMLKRGRVPEDLGLWWVHGLFLALGVYFFWRRANNLPLLPVPALFWRRAA